MSPRYAPFIAILALFLSSCGPSIAQTIRIHPQAPNDQYCDVAFETSSITDHNPFPGYSHIGVVHVQRSPFHWTDELEILMSSKVCEMGGDLASIVAATAEEGKDKGVITVYIFRGDRAS